MNPASHYFFSNDTVVKKGIKFRVTNFAIQYNLGAVNYLYDSKTEKYFGNNWSWTETIFVYYKNYFYGVTAGPSRIDLKDTLYFSAAPIYKDKLLDIDRISIFLGYNINLPHSFNVAPYADFLMTSFFSDHKQYDFLTPGFGFGFFLNKYITLRPRRYFVIFITNNFNQAYYSKFNSSLGDHYYSISFGIGYKAWFLKKIKE